MADTTKCANEQCEKRNTCYRFWAPDSDWQSYSHFKPDDDGNCEYYWFELPV